MADSRVAVVIGGASGIGWATAKVLAGEGARVTIADRNTDGAAARAAELGDPHAWTAVEVTDEDSVAALFDGVVAREGGLHVVVNCAGFSGFGLITELDAYRTWSSLRLPWTPWLPCSSRGLCLCIVWRRWSVPH